MPTWTTLGRPVAPREGEFGYNVETNAIEVWGGAWHVMMTTDYTETNFVKKTGDTMSGSLGTTVIGAATGNILKFGDTMYGDLTMGFGDVVLEDGNPAIGGDGTSKITVSNVEPASPVEGDLWVDTA